MKTHRPAVLRLPRRAALAGSLLIATLTGGTTLAQGGTWGAVFPEAGVIGPPAWVEPGTRIVSYVAAASVAGTRYRYIEERGGGFRNLVTGQEYRREEYDTPGGRSGEGYLVVDIVAVEPDQVVGAATLYVLDRGNGGVLTYLPIGGGPEPAGAMDSVWLHPSILATFVNNGSAPGAEVLVGPYPVGDTVRDIVALRSGDQDFAFDPATGLVLVGTGNAMQQLAQVHLPGESPPVGSSMLTYQRLLGTRTRTLAGTGAPAPGWMRTGTELRYEGTYTALETPFSPSSTVPARVTLVTEAAGPSWGRFRVVHETADLGTLSMTETWAVTGGTGPFWYDSSALASMQQGDVLDVDELLGLRTWVSEVGDGPFGPRVAITTEGPGMLTWFDYDVASGVALRYERHQLGSVDSFWLTQMP